MTSIDKSVRADARCAQRRVEPIGYIHGLSGRAAVLCPGCDVVPLGWRVEGVVSRP